MSLLLFLCAFPALIVLLRLFRALLERVRVSRLESRAVLITGCDSGFGFDLALRCLRERMRVFAACFTELGIQKLREAAKEQGIGTEKLETLQMDVRSDESVGKALEFVEANLEPGRGIHALVNNAGITSNASWDDWLELKDFEDAWNVNTLGTIRVTHAFKPLIIREKQSRIVIMASSCGRVALPCLGPYNVSKFGVEGYADTIRTELIMFGIKVSVLEPGFFRTPITNLKRASAILDCAWTRLPDPVKRTYGIEFYEFSSKFMCRFLDPANLNPRTDLVVDAYWQAISSAWPRRRYQIGFDAHCFYHPLALLPAELQDLVFFLLMTVFRIPPPACPLLIKEKQSAKAEANGHAD